MVDVSGLGGSGIFQQVQQRIFQRADSDGSGAISQQEFESAAANAPGGGIPDAEAAFAKLDGDGDGQLSQDEFAAGLREAIENGGGPGGFAPTGGGAADLDLVEALFGTEDEDAEDANQRALREIEEALESGDSARLSELAGTIDIVA